MLIIDRPQNLFRVLVQADRDCGFTTLLDLVTYPPKGKYHGKQLNETTLRLTANNRLVPGNPSNENYRRSATPPGYNSTLCDFIDGTNTVEELEFLINGTACYGQCAVGIHIYIYSLTKLNIAAIEDI